MHKWVLHSSAALLKAFHDSFTDIQNRDGEKPLRYLDLSGDWQSKLAKDLLH